MKRFKHILTMLALLPALALLPTGANAQTLTLSPSTIPAGHTGRVITVTLTPGGADTTLVGKTFSVTNNSAGLNSTSVTITGQTVSSATSATLTVTTGAGGGPATVSDGTTSATLTQRIPFIRTSPTYIPASATTTITVNELNTLNATDNAQMAVSGVSGASAGTTTWSSDTTGTVSITTGAATGSLTLTDPATGASTQVVIGSPAQRVYIPYFSSLSGLTSPSGLSIASNGGLVATTAGTAGTATIPLGAYIDLALPWRVGVLLEYNGDAANTVSVTLAGTQPNANQSNLGGNVNGGYIVPNNGYQTMPGVSGQRYWIYVSSAGMALDTTNSVTQGVTPAYLAGLSSIIVGPGTGQSDYNSLFYPASSGYAYSGTQYEDTPLFGIGSLSISTKSTTTRILGLLVQQGSLAGGTDPQCQPPALVSMTVNGDTTARVRLCGQYDGTTPTPLAIISHPNASDEATGLRYNDADAGAALALVSRGGYNEAWMRATTNYTGTTYTAPPASGWGSPAQEAFWNALITWNKTNLPATGKVYWLGQSMGGVTGLRYHMAHPGVLSGFYGISPVTNLSYAYSSESFNAIIDSAYGTSGTFVTGGSAATYDPNLNPSAFAGAALLPIRIFHGSADTVIHEANHALLLQTNINAASGKVSVVTVPGAGHLDKAALWDGVDILKFFNALNAPPAGGTKRRLQ